MTLDNLSPVHSAPQMTLFAFASMGYILAIKITIRQTVRSFAPNRTTPF
jgi:hypothetical protein